MLWSWINVHYIQQVHTLDYWSLKSKDDHIYTYMHNAFHTLSTFNANKVKKRKKKIMIPIYSNHLFHFYIFQEPILLKKEEIHVLIFWGFSFLLPPLVTFLFHIIFITHPEPVLEFFSSLFMDSDTITTTLFDLNPHPPSPRCGNAIRCLSMIWLSEANSYES